ncbi:MAG: hypothetical protein B6I31_00615 [Desulfobacteraceae bacterium 4572_19]|nr:MAG: hypothetical protein B6I31_00615 [Desulfobacteraceae bacterium 4572_19]
MKEKIDSNTEDLLEVLCNSVQRVLKISTQTEITSPLIAQKITSIGLNPDIACFVVVEGGFSGLAVLNFSEDAAMEIYKKYMLSMGMPEDELATQHTSDDVADSLGELINQIFGDFRMNLEKELQITINQNVPKMITLNEAIVISRASTITVPEYRRVAFFTEEHKPFYLQISMEDTNFMALSSSKDVDDDNDYNDVVDDDPNDIMAEFGF